MLDLVMCHVSLFGNLLAMVVPALRLLEDPDLRIRETVPEVVGFQLNIRDCPAEPARPEDGMLKGLAVLVA